jgi:lipopolysaccharide/colanic/teichoic acid biosynthesis glycosyltransferase
MRSYLVGKRILDVSLGAVLLLLCLPVLLPAAVLVRLSGPGPVLFRQTRVGLHERPFTMLKLRTMHTGCDDAGQRDFNTRELQGTLDGGEHGGVFKPTADPRITPVGRILRRYSIDEIPQLLNVLKGDMSLVGPRPSLPWEVELYTCEQRRRHECLPGLTGLWQVSGRNRLSMPEMLDLDLAYLRSRSFLLDLRILARTPRAVLSGDETR